MGFNVYLWRFRRYSSVFSCLSVEIKKDQLISFSFSLYLALQTTPYMLLSNRTVLKPSKILKFRKICSESTLLIYQTSWTNRPRWIRWVMECCSPILQMGVRCPHQRLRRKNWARWTRDMKIWPQRPTPSLKVCYTWRLLYLKLLIKVSFHILYISFQIFNQSKIFIHHFWPLYKTRRRLMRISIFQFETQ